MTTEPFDIEAFLETAPRGPGCYIMRDRRGKVIYVGKAKGLRARIRQYFGASSDSRFFVGMLSGLLGEIETVLCANDKEAILLENELIKAHQPPFNVKLKDDKSFLHIRIDRSKPYPRLEVVRRKKRDNAQYFGPYDSATAIRNTLRLINRHFYLRTCPDSEFNNRSRPCLEHQIHRCPGPCVLPYPADKYAEHVEEVALFLSGRADELTGELHTRMMGASERMDYELAAHYRDQITAVERSMVRQHVALDAGLELDAIGLFREGPHVAVQVLQVRRGYVTGSRGFALGRHELPDAEVARGFVQQYYDDHTRIPDEILLPVPIEDCDALAEWLTDRRGKRVTVHHPQRGKKVRLLEMATANAEQRHKERQQSTEEAAQTLARLQQRLGLRNFPSRIECYDISNTQGREAVASMVVFLDGEPAKSEYRHFRMRAPAEPNDFLMMYEALTRRMRRGIDTGELPSLVVIDGGKGQLNAARQALAELDIVDVDIVSLAKSKVQDGSGTSSEAPTRSAERVFLPGAKNALVLRQNSAELFLLARLRDEAHRFAITHHKKLRDKRTLKSALDDIPGVGEARRNALLRHFGSVRRVAAADAAAIAEVEGIGPLLAETIAEHLRR
jgi:excinuclease ABC subunit C